jgi:hypothetical protein
MLLVGAVALPASSCDKDKAGCPCRCKTIASLMMAIESDNQGLKESAAFVLGEIKCTQAVVPLMRFLHDGECESTRAVAALALTLIGDPRGVYAVKQAVTHDPSKRVQLQCAYFYNQYVQPETFAFIPTGEPVPPQLASE